MKTLRLLLLLVLATGAVSCSRPSQVGRMEEDVRLMQHYQRQADNGAFYQRRQAALKDMRLLERFHWLLSREGKERYGRALTQFHLVSATYFYTLGQQERAEAEMRAVDVGDPTTTSQQWLEYRFLSGYYSYGPTAGRIGIRQCADIARELAADDPFWAAESSVIAAAQLNADGSYRAAIDTLQALLDSSSAVTPSAVPADDGTSSSLSPEVLCRLCEQMSVAYAGLADKESSDNYRNQYLDLLETIREDKELESRSRELEERTRQLRALMVGAGIFVAVFGILFFVLARRWRRSSRRILRQLDEELEESRQEMQNVRAMSALHVERYKRDNVVRKTSLSIVTSIIPLIDRMRREVRRGGSLSDGRSATADDIAGCEYVSELADEVNRINDILTQWIQTRQGMVSLHIECFALQDLFDILAKSSGSMANQQLRLSVLPTATTVKADRALTLFMLNTLVGNARKFTPAGGTVTVEATDGDGYVELSVADDGQGMTSEEVERILREKVLTSDSHGFGLLNCKGIIDKYRKTDDLFAVCRLGIESEKEKGTRVWFRLPKVARALRLLAGAVLLLAGTSCLTPDGTLAVHGPDVGAPLPYDSLLMAASSYADSVYFANVEGDYEQAVVFADSAVAYLNRYAALCDSSLQPLAVSGKGSVVEKSWWMADFETDYFTILDIRNELAIANLALCRWSDYRFNNRAYTELYKLLSEDISLADYCRRMQNSYREMVALVVLCVAVLLAFLAGYLLLSVRPRRKARQQKEERNAEYERTKNDDGDLSRLQHEENRLYVQNLVLDNCLSAIKHETMYYPARIKQLADAGRTDELQELVDYYSDVYGTLAACAARQLETVTFRRSAVPVAELGADAPDTLAADGDRILLEYMVESLRREAVGETTFTAHADGDFVRFTFVDRGATAADDELPHWFDPSADNMHVLLRQIVREHDEYFNHVGCRIRAVRPDDGQGVAIVFTLPIADKPKRNE